MRLRRALWRTAGPVTGRVAPAAFRQYYRAVVGSLVRRLVGIEGTVAVYAHGSYAADSLRPGRSDVDLDVVVEDLDPEGEVELLAALGRRYRPHQAVLPIDLTVLARSEFPHDAGWIAGRRRWIGTDELIAPINSWALLGGEELRTAPVWRPHPHHTYLREEYFLTPALTQPGSRVAVAGSVARLARMADREELDWPAASELRRAARTLSARGGLLAALTAALGVVDAEQARHQVAAENRPDLDDWRLPQPASEAVSAAARLGPPAGARSATLYVDPLTLLPTLLLEVASVEEARAVFAWALDRGSRDAQAAGIGLELATTRMAEASWRSRFRWVGLAGASHHLGGEPLRPRIALPDEALWKETLDQRAFTGCEGARSTLLGLRTKSRGPAVLPQLALARDLLAGRPPQVPSPDAAEAGLDDRAWTRRAIELRRECAALARPSLERPRRPDSSSAASGLRFA